MANDQRYPYKLNFVFHMRLRAESKGKPRPRIIAIDWNNKPSACGQFVEQMLAVSTSNQTRVFGEVLKMVGNTQWTEWNMLLNKVHRPEMVTTALKWHPTDGKILAIGSDDDTNHIIDIFQWQDEKFKRHSRVKITRGGFLSSISWQSLGGYLLGTLDPSNDDTEAQAAMVIIKNPTNEDRLITVIDTGYKMAFCAVFHPDPTTSYVVTTSVGSSSIHLWDEDEANNWQKVKSIRSSLGITKMCFNDDGSLLAAIGHKLIIWTCTTKDEAGQPVWNLRRRPNTVNGDSMAARIRGATLTQHCENLTSLAFCWNDDVITGSSLGSICLHGVTEGKHQTSFKVIAFQWCDVQQYFPDGEITCVGSSPQRSGSGLVASAGTDGLVIIWKSYKGIRPESDRNTNIERYCYAPGWDVAQADESINMDADVETINSISTDRSSQDIEDLEQEKDSSAKGQEASIPKETDPSVDKKGEEIALSAILAELQSFRIKQKEVEEKLELIQNNVTAQLEDVRNTVVTQNVIFESICHNISKKIGQ